MAYNSFQNIHAYDIVEETKDAYSFDRYGRKSWFKCARFLLAEGYTRESVVQILRSKHMRWAADRSATSLGGYITFRKYYRTEQSKGYSNTGKYYIDVMLKAST